MSITGQLKPRYVRSRAIHQYAQAISRFVTVDDVQLHFMIKGAGRPVVLIHGNPGSCNDWAGLFDPLATGNCYFSFDRPGHGHSQRPNQRPLTVEIQTEMLHAALENLGVNQPVLVGHSWGAALALAYAIQFPNDLSGAVLVAPAAYESKDGISFLTKLPAWPIVGELMNHLLTPVLGARIVREDLQKAFAPDPVPPGYLRRALQEWTQPKKVKWYAADDALLDQSLPKLVELYSTIRAPVTIVTGDSDLIVPARENAYRLYETLPQAEFMVLRNTGHQIPLTRPEAVVDAIERVRGMAAAGEARTSLTA